MLHPPTSDRSDEEAEPARRKRATRTAPSASRVEDVTSGAFGPAEASCSPAARVVVYAPSQAGLGAMLGAGGG